MAELIDQTLLRPDATDADVEQLCQDALSVGFKSVCLNPCHVRRSAALLQGTHVGVCSVVDFPLGASGEGVRRAEAVQALDDGARELDIVMNAGLLKSGRQSELAAGISAIVRLAHTKGALVKVIIEAPLLNDREKVEASRLVVDAGGDFVKTSTGFEGRRATVQDVRLIRETVGPSVGVKAAGGIRTFDDLRAMVAAGANRIGTSAGIHILREAQEQTILRQL